MLARLVASVVLLVAVPAMSDEGNLSPKEIVAVMSTRRLQIRKLCYDDATAKADTSVRVDVTVAGSGVVIDVQQREASGPEDIRSCIVSEVKKTTFPMSPKGAWFRWPFVFKGP